MTGPLNRPAVNAFVEENYLEDELIISVTLARRDYKDYRRRFQETPPLGGPNECRPFP